MADRRINLALREQNPAERVVPLRALRRKPQDFFEGCASAAQIAVLHLPHPLLINRRRPPCAVRRRGARRLREARISRAECKKKKNSAALEEIRPPMNKNEIHARESA